MNQTELQYKERNIKLFTNHLNFMDSLLKNYTPIIPRDSDHFAVLFELRPLKEIKTIIKNHMFFLNNSDSKIKWGLQIFHGTKNEEYVKEELKDIENIKYENLGIENIKHIKEHTALLKTIDFWEKVKGKKVLFFQTDSMLLRHGIDEFLEYDYVGGPWLKPKDGVYVGNGGLSLRTKNKMIEILKKHPNDSQNYEDIYFSIHLNGKNVPTVDIAKKFSVEDTFYINPFGIHKPHKIPSNLLEEIFKNNVSKFTI